jgi:hypothetical protein
MLIIECNNSDIIIDEWGKERKSDQYCYTQIGKSNRYKDK